MKLHEWLLREAAVRGARGPSKNLDSGVLSDAHEVLARIDQRDLSVEVSSQLATPPAVRGSDSDGSRSDTNRIVGLLREGQPDLHLKEYGEGQQLDPPVNADVPLSWAVSGRLDEATAIMEFLISNDAVLDPIDTGLFERYERDASSQLEEKSSATVTTLSIEEASPDVQQALAAVVRWADETFPTGSLVQHEVPLGATRVSRTAESSSRQQLELDRSLDDVDPTSESPERLPYEHDLARAGGARTAAGTVKADFIVLADDSVYIGEIKSASERIESQREAYHALGQVLDYAIRFSEDFPTLAREADVYPIIATPEPGVDTEILSPSFEAHGVGLLETTGRNWAIEPNGNFQPPYREFLQD